MKLNIQLFASVSSAKYDGRYLKLSVVEESYSIENNTSTLKWTFESIGGSSSYYTIYNYGAYVNGTQVYDGNSGLKTKNYSTHSLPVTKGSTSGTITITHKDDGSADPVPFVLYGKVYKSGTASFTGSVDLTTIPRASQPRLSSSNVDMGTTITIYTDRVSTSFTHTIRYGFGSASGTIATNVTDSVSWTPSVNLANQIPSAASGIGIIYCDTYSNGTLIGTKTIDLTLNVPSNIVPSVSFTNVSEAGDVPSSWGVYVKTKSRIALAISGSGVYGSAISGYKISYYGGAVLTQSATTSYLTQAGSTTFTGQVTDTRGRSASTTTTINVVDYSNPTISIAQVQRCDANGNIDNNGEYMYISYGASISSCSNKNTPSAVYKVGYRVHNTGNYTYVNLTTNANSYSANGVLFSDGIKAASSSGTKVQFSTTYTYDIIFYVKDYFMEYTNLQSLDTGFDLMNFNASGKAMAIGKVSEAGADTELFEVGMRTEINGPLVLRNFNNSVIIGDQNNAYVHFNSDQNKSFYFNRNVSVNGNVYAGSSYNRQLAFKDETWYNGTNTPSNNLNNAIHDGCYYWEVNTTNRPPTPYGHVLVTNSAGIEHNNTDNWCSQIGFGTDGNVYYRNKANSGSWGVWRFLDTSRTITLNGEWRHATKAYGTGWFMFLPLNNPTKTSPTLSITNCEYFGTGGWKSCTPSLGEVRDTDFKINFGNITESETQNGNVLIRMTGTITLTL